MRGWFFIRDISVDFEVSLSSWSSLFCGSGSAFGSSRFRPPRPAPSVDPHAVFVEIGEELVVATGDNAVSVVPGLLVVTDAVITPVDEGAGLDAGAVVERQVY